MEIYTGLGYDIHRLVSGAKLILGGVVVPFKKGFLAHSDGDVLLHALIDAILGASGLNDIGTYFPDNEMKYKNIDSKILLSKVMEIIATKKLILVNIDATIICQKPKLAEYKEEIKKSLSLITGLSQARIAVKAKTKETLDSVGKGKAIEVFCAVLVKRIENES